MNLEKGKLEVGDWVRAKTTNGELIHGYLVKAHPEYSKAALKVIRSDNEHIIGSTLRLYKEDIIKLDNRPKYTVKQLETLIDMALASKDKQWFIELSTELKKIKGNDHTGTDDTKYKDNYQESTEQVCVDLDRKGGIMQQVYSDVIQFRGTHYDFGYMQGKQLKDSYILPNRRKQWETRRKRHFNVDACE